MSRDLCHVFKYFSFAYTIAETFHLIPKTIYVLGSCEKTCTFFTEVHYFLKSSILNELPPKRFLCKE